MSDEIVGFFQVIEAIAIPRSEAVIDLIIPSNNKPSQGNTVAYRLYQALGRMRYDMLYNNKIVASYIAHFDKRHMWVLDPVRNTYRELKLGPKFTLTQHKENGKVTLAGHGVTHHEATFSSVPNIPVHLNWWLTSDNLIHKVQVHLPKRCDNVPGSMRMEWQATKTDKHRVPREMFDIPANYHLDKNGIEGTDYVSICGYKYPLKGQTTVATPEKAAPIFNVGNLMKNTTVKSGRVRS